MTSDRPRTDRTPRPARQAGASGRLLKRYTRLSVAIDMLVAERLTLLSPSSWQDGNDIAFMDAYREVRGLGAVLAACFTQAPETFHHWATFAGGSDGVRIDIDGDALLGSLAGDDGYRWGDVTYLTLRQIAARASIPVADLPFLKRHAFRDEREFRLIRHAGDAGVRTHDVPIRRSWVRGITLGPWLPANLADSAKAALRALPGCGGLYVQRTHLRDNARWRGALARLAGGD